MGKNTSIILGEYFDKLINNQISMGRYASASEMIREGLRLLDERNKNIESINKALIQGEKSGEPHDYNYSS